MQNKNFFVFTGGPGTGKTTVLRNLAKKHYRCIDEVARKVIQEQPAHVSKNPLWRKSLEFTELTLNRSVELYLKEYSTESGITFFDRGLVDSIFHPEIETVPCSQYRYNDTAFIFPPWKEIYINDEERIQSYEESVEVYYSCTEMYKKFGYELLIVPKASVDERADFILTNVDRLK